MKIFTKKKIIQKILIAIVLVTLFNFIIPNISHADDEESGVKGVLFEPIKDFLLGIGDVASWVMNKIIYQADETFLDIYYEDTLKAALRDSDSFWDSVTKGFEWIDKKCGKLADNIQDWLNGYGWPTSSHSLPKHVRLPMIMLSPEEMFKGEVPLLDVNFFNPKEDTYTEYTTRATRGDPKGSPITCVDGKLKNQYTDGTIVDTDWTVEEAIKRYFKDYMHYESDNMNVIVNHFSNLSLDQYADKLPYVSEYMKAYSATVSWYNDTDYYEAMVAVAVTYLDNDENNTVLDFYFLEGTIGVYESIITERPTSDAKTIKSSSAQLQPIISKWYYALRNLAIVALLSILVYIAIRIIISSSMEDRAKYKQHLLDWLIAMCLLFFMHYIMSFAVTLTEEITKALEPMSEPYPYRIVDSGDGEGRTLDKYYVSDGTPVLEVDGVKKIENGIVWPVNLMGKARLDLQMEPPEYDDNQILMKNFSLTIIYLGLVMYTVLFLFRYLKRLLMLTFLTIIAPFMAMTYPLDKIHDNSAQGFNMWLKEYIFNLLIQPLHLILYTVLIGSAIEFASENIIYSLVAFGFMLQGEKIMRRLFGFEKAQTASATSAALGGALAMQGIEMISKHLKGGKSVPKDKQEKNKIAQANRKPDKDINELTRKVFGTNQNGAGSNDSGTPINNGGAPGGGAPNGNPNGQNAPQNNNQPDGTGNNQPPNQQGTDSGTQGSGNNTQGSGNSGQTQNQNGSQGAGSGTNRTVESVQEKIIELVQNKFKEKLEESKYRQLANRVGTSKFGKGIKYVGPKLAKTGLKAVLKAGLMATGATIGLTAGLVSDDFSNVFKYGAVGAGAGLLTGNAIPNKISNLKENISKEYDGFYEATHTKEEINARMDKKALEDKARIKKYQEKFGVDRAGAQVIMKEVAQQYRDYGITDDDIIIKAIKNKDLNDEEKIMLAKMAQQVNGDEEKYDALKEGLNDRGLRLEEIEKYLNIIRDMNNWV